MSLNSTLRYFYSWVLMPLLTGAFYGAGYLIGQAFFRKYILTRFISHNEVILETTNKLNEIKNKNISQNKHYIV